MIDEREQQLQWEKVWQISQEMGKLGRGYRLSEFDQGFLRCLQRFLEGKKPYPVLQPQHIELINVLYARMML